MNVSLTNVNRFFFLNFILFNPRSRLKKFRSVENKDSIDCHRLTQLPLSI